MSQVIPGGRPRASSDGDILDEGLCGALFVNLNDRHNEVPRRNPGRTVNVNINSNNISSNHLDYGDDAFDSDSELSSQSQSSSARSRRRRFSFKSMRKAVSRAFVKDPNSKLGDTAAKKSDKLLRVCDLSKVWTPDLRHLGEGYSGKSNKSGNEHSDSGTMSTSRPLITDPNLGMTVPKWKKTPGTAGIYNHGNSCFMNAVLQCLSNTDSFTEYFVKDFFKSDLRNSKNGKKGVFRTTHGEVTEQLGHLLKCLWSGKYTSDVSKEFKSVVGKFNNQYKGDHQHDAQEFLLWLLDRIHEDVSTFTKKKTKPPKTPVLKSDEELATEAALVNGDSFVLKLFQALHSSTLICPTCGERSSTFDPYLCVSLPLPQRCPRVVYVIVVSLEHRSCQEVKMAFTVNQFDGVRDLREHVAADTKIPIKQLLLVQLKDDGFGATYSDEQPLSDIPENEEVYAVETYSEDASMYSSTAQEFDSPTAQVLVMHVEIITGSPKSYRFGSPSLLKVRRDVTWKGLQKEILCKMEDSVFEEILPHKLSNLFLLRICDGSSRKSYLTSDVEMPLYTQSAERAFSTLDEDFGPPHIKIIAEWDTPTKKKVVRDDKEHIEIHESVTEAQKNPPGQGKVSLEECFKLYTQEEKLIGDDAWLCPHCKQQQQGTIKTLSLWSLPEILVLHLKRFKQSGLRRSKLNTLVEFPVENLDMSGHLSRRSQGNSLKRDDYTYDLLGVSNHYGNMMGGHYTAFCRSPVDGMWREFNDTKVRALEGPVATREAYLLFYQRRSLSKDINQRLFTGDHWVFSLPLSPSERIDDETPLTGETTPRDTEAMHPPKRSRSRSASPSSHRQVIRDASGVATRRIPARPLTPQPRRPVISYTDEKDFDDDSRPTSPQSPQRNSPTRRSRSIQRQASEPSQAKREKSAGAGTSSTYRVKDPSRTLYNRRNSDEENPKESNFEFTRRNSKRDIGNGVSRNASLNRGKASERDKPVTVVNHNTSRISDLSIHSSKNNSHSSYLREDSLESDAKYPSLPYDHTRYSESNGYSSFEPASALRVKLDDRDYPPPTYTLKSDFEQLPVSDNEMARRKLAQLIKQESVEKALADRAHVSIDPIEEEEPFIRSGARRYESQKSYTLAQNNLLDDDFYTDSNLSYPTANGHSFRGFDSLTSDHRDRDIGYVPDRMSRPILNYSHRSKGYSRLEEKENFIDLSLGPQSHSDLRSKLGDGTNYRKFRSLADEHFGNSNGSYNKERYTPRFSDDTAFGNRDYISPQLNGDTSRLNKFATFGRAYNTFHSSRHDRDTIPRSITDHSIHYDNPSLVPPPSPTPPHSLREEQTFSHISGPSSLPSSNSDYLRDVPSKKTFDFSGRRTSEQDSIASSGTRSMPRYASGIRESKHNFRPPRGVWGVKAKPSKTVGKIPTPCLRESSV